MVEDYAEKLHTGAQVYVCIVDNGKETILLSGKIKVPARSFTYFAQPPFHYIDKCSRFAILLFCLQGNPMKPIHPWTGLILDLDIRETFVTPSSKTEMSSEIFLWAAVSHTGAHPRSPTASHWLTRESFDGIDIDFIQCLSIVFHKHIHCAWPFRYAEYGPSTQHVCGICHGWMSPRAEQRTMGLKLSAKLKVQSDTCWSSCTLRQLWSALSSLTHRLFFWNRINTSSTSKMYRSSKKYPSNRKHMSHMYTYVLFWVDWKCRKRRVLVLLLFAAPFPFAAVSPNNVAGSASSVFVLLYRDDRSGTPCRTNNPLQVCCCRDKVHIYPFCEAPPLRSQEEVPFLRQAHVETAWAH